MHDYEPSSRKTVLTEDRIVVGREPVSVPSGRMPKPRKAPAPAETAHEPQVQAVTGPDGSVHSILVRCTCGREITLQCEYFADGGEDAKTDLPAGG